MMTRHWKAISFRSSHLVIIWNSMNGRQSLVAGGWIFCETKGGKCEKRRAGDQVEIVSRWRQGACQWQKAKARQQAVEESETMRSWCGSITFKYFHLCRWFSGIWQEMMIYPFLQLSWRRGNELLYLNRLADVVTEETSRKVKLSEVEGGGIGSAGAENWWGVDGWSRSNDVQIGENPPTIWRRDTTAAAMRVEGAVQVKQVGLDWGGRRKSSWIEKGHKKGDATTDWMTQRGRGNLSEYCFLEQTTNIFMAIMNEERQYKGVDSLNIGSKKIPVVP